MLLGRVSCPAQHVHPFTEEDCHAIQSYRGFGPGGLPAQNCIQHEFCGKGVAVEHDGSVYSCDHYVYPEYRLGTFRERPLADLVFSPRQVKFGYAKAETLPRYCRACAYLRDCWGECPKNRLIRTPDGEPGLNYLCAGFQRFFHHALPTVDRIAASLRREPGS